MWHFLVTYRFWSFEGTVHCKRPVDSHVHIYVEETVLLEKLKADDLDYLVDNVLIVNQQCFGFSKNKLGQKYYYYTHIVTSDSTYF